MTWNKGKGKAVKWLRDHTAHAGDDCLMYPFYRNKQLGYVMFGLNGKLISGHRFMCELRHGPPPTRSHEAAHTCGNGQNGCLNPNHLQWKTKQENAQDRKRHGNYIYEKGKPRFVLRPEQVAEIRALKGVQAQIVLAERFGVSRQTISGIQTGALYYSERSRRIWDKRDPKRISV